jgi:hypothetical protein
MASCPSCSTANPDSAKFCAHCGKPLPAAAVSPQAQRVAQPMASPRQPSGANNPPAQPAAHGVRPEPLTGKQVFQQKSQRQSFVNTEPDPSAPGQTQFFVAAAGVSASSKIKRVVFFFIGAILIGVVIFFGLRFALKVSNENITSRVAPETTETQPGTEAAGSAAPSTQPADQPDQPAVKPDEKSEGGSVDTPAPTTGKSSKKK